MDSTDLAQTAEMVISLIGRDDPLDARPAQPDALGMLFARVEAELGQQCRFNVMRVTRVDWEARAMFDGEDSAIRGYGTRTNCRDAVGRGHTASEALHELLEDVREQRAQANRGRGRLVA